MLYITVMLVTCHRLIAELTKDRQTSYNKIRNIAKLKRIIINISIFVKWGLEVKENL